MAVEAVSPEAVSLAEAGEAEALEEEDLRRDGKERGERCVVERKRKILHCEEEF